jgi:proteasome lid subunit RPN8/RPN11
MGMPVFLQQSALQAMYEHLAATPPAGQGVLGFLLGDRCECTVSGVSYSVIDAALRLNQTIYSDRSRDVVTRLWKRLQTQIEEQQAHLIGWYHTHPPLPLEFSEHDVETQDLYFGEPWQVGVLVGTDAAAPAGAFFRLGSDDAWVRTPQPFYELLNEDSVRAGGKKRSFMTWKNYRAYNPPALQPRAGSPAPTRPPAPPPEPPEPESSGVIAGFEQTALTATPPPRVPPRQVERRVEHAAPPAPEPEDPTSMDNMPQAELEEPARTELEESPQEEQREEPDAAEEEDEQEDAGALKFLSAAEDSPPPLPTRSGEASPFLPPPLPPSFASPEEPPSELAPVEALEASEEAAWPEEPALESEAPQDEVVEGSEAVEPEPVAKPRRASRGTWRKLVRRVMVGVVVLVVVAGGVAAWPYVPSLVQRVKAMMPSRAAAPKAAPRPAPVAAPVAPSPAAPRPVAPRPPIVPRAEFASLDLAADSLARALQAYGGRTRLFEKRRLDCFILSRGAVRVERAAASYRLQRNAAGTTLDNARGVRDADLRAAIDSASRQFLRSACEHP